MIRRHLRLAASLLALSAATALLYCSRLDYSPPYLSIDEVEATRQAVLLSTTGRSRSGQWLPLYIGEPNFEAGREPMWIYVTALSLKAWPLSETLIRAKSAAAGVLDVVLIFVLVRYASGSTAFSLIAAVLLALSPAHFMLSRVATPLIAPVPFTLGWLILLTRFFQTNSNRTLFLACLTLGLSTYTFLSGFVLMPFHFLSTLAVVVWHPGESRAAAAPADARRRLLVACAGLAVALLPYLVWTLAHPERFHQLLTFYSGHGYNPDLAAKDLSLAKAVIARADAWWNAFNPERLFFVGDSDYRLSTRKVGYFLWPTALFLVVGLVRMREVLPKKLAFVCYAGLVYSAVPVILTLDVSIKHWISVSVFIVIASAAGAQVLWNTGRHALRAAAITAACAGLLQFGLFLQDYYGDYRARSTYYFGGNLKGAVLEVLNTTRDPRCVFFERSLTFEQFWALYTSRHGTAAITHPPQAVDSARFNLQPPSVCQQASLVIPDQLIEHGAFRALTEWGWRRTPLAEPDGGVLLAVFHWSRNSGGQP